MVEKWACVKIKPPWDCRFWSMVSIYQDSILAMFDRKGFSEQPSTLSSVWEGGKNTEGSRVPREGRTKKENVFCLVMIGQH